MSKKNKSKGNVFEPKNFVVVGIAATVVVLIAVLMNLLVPTTTNNEKSFDSAAWEAATNEAEQNALEKAENQELTKDSGLTSVYDEAAVAVAAESVPQTETNDENSATSQRNNSSAMMIMPIAGTVTKDYSGDELVYSETMNDWRTHNGIDIAANEGTDVFAVADGTVEAVTDSGMMGTTVIILHQNGIRSIYSNLSDKDTASAGDTVTQGSIIGKTGDTASEEVSEPPHLHFEISLNEEPVNPHDYLPTENNAE